MEGLLFWVVAAVVGTLLLRSLFPSHEPPQIIYVQVEPQRENRAAGCLPLILGLAVAFILLAALV